MKISVIIPAHNEAACIEACLQAMQQGLGETQLQVLVICNGCSDQTANLARRLATNSTHDIQVHELEEASKSAALNRGDSAALHFPRFYVDADVVVSGAALGALAQRLQPGQYMACSPRLELNLEHSNAMVRAFYRTWMQLPYVTQNLIGCGVYGLSAAGRSRFGEFPNLIADDCFVRLQFTGDEKHSVAEQHFSVRAPRTLSSLIRINSRRLEGQRQLRKHFRQTTQREGQQQKRVLLSRLANPLGWPDLLIYLWVRLASMTALRLRLMRGERETWSRDESSRAIVAERTKLPPGGEGHQEAQAMERSIES